MWMGECLFHNKFQQQLTISQLQSKQIYSLYSQGLYNVFKHTNSPPNREHWRSYSIAWPAFHHYYVNLSLLFTQKSLKMISYQQYFSPFFYL
jgi:hypothetical protein